MSDPNNKNLLWDDTAIKLIQYATKFRHNADEFERLVGYLLLDAGVETLLRSFLIMSDTKTNIDKLNLHDLVEKVRQVAGSKINEIDLEDAKRYHNVRNKIYHQGEGFFPPKKKFEGYLELAERLLETLLNTNKQPKDIATDGERREEALKKLSLAVAMLGMQEEFRNLQLNIAVTAEAFNPRSTRKSFEKSLKEIQNNYPDNEDDSVSDRYENQLERIKGFQKLTETDTDDIDFIDKAIYDIAYLHLAVLYNHNVVDDNDIDDYFKYREFVERFHDRPNDASREDREEILQLRGWAKKLKEKLDVLIKNQTPSDQQGEES